MDAQSCDGDELFTGEGMSSKEVKKYLPHREPFLLIQHVDTVVPWRKCIAYNQIRVDDPVFVGHFPGRPIYPGVLILESLAQSFGLLLHASSQLSVAEFRRASGVLSGIDKSRFLHPVLPGECLRCVVELTAKKPPLYVSHCEAYVGDKKVAKARVSVCFSWELGDNSSFG
ncbi:MAG: 3-hydroxyacyl-ACP dehydratase FabZ [Proteobacteria bacterium]|nr:3-hydroxyacyl-ACP dehydratase FabZ [Pseudomonadota bacterium]